MTRLALVLTVGILSLSASRADGQEQQVFPSWSPERALWADPSSTPALAAGDSVRQKVGYRHWEGAAIGTAAGAVVGLVLAVAGRYSCSDCADNGSIVGPSVVGAGLAGAFGFLVGLASPKYRWVADTAAIAP